MAPGDTAYAGLYRLSSTQALELDRHEGGYERRTLGCLLVDHEAVEAFTYLPKPQLLVQGVQPYEWYRQLVIAGARALDLPPDYLERLVAEPAKADPDTARRERNEALLVRLDKTPVSLDWLQLQPASLIS